MGDYYVPYFVFVCKTEAHCVISFSLERVRAGNWNVKWSWLRLWQW